MSEEKELSWWRNIYIDWLRVYDVGAEIIIALLVLGVTILTWLLVFTV